MRIVVPVVFAVGALLLPGTAVANSGSITNVARMPDGQFTATYTTTSTRCDAGDGYCGWFPYASQVGPNDVCDPNNTAGRLTYVGQLQNDPGTQGPTTDTFYPDHTGTFKICLHISYGTNDNVNVTEIVYTPPAAPTPTPTPEGADEDVAPLGISEARRMLPSVLRKKYGSRYTSRRGSLKKSCYRLSSEKVRCGVSWNTKRYRYSGNATMWNDPDDADSILFTTSIRGKRRATSSPPASRSCDPNYAGACLKPNVSDYDCAGGSGDGPYYTGPVRVVGNDHYDLDRDGDGYACDV